MTPKTDRKIEVGDVVTISSGKYLVLEKVQTFHAARRHAAKQGAKYTFVPGAGWLVIQPITDHRKVF